MCRTVASDRLQHGKSKHTDPSSNGASTSLLDAYPARLCVCLGDLNETFSLMRWYFRHWKLGSPVGGRR